MQKPNTAKVNNAASSSPTSSFTSSGSDLFSQEAKSAMQRSERIMVGNSYETALIYDANGQLIFKKKGTHDQVEFTSKEVKRMKGCVVTHNHPGGSTFSGDDIFLLKNSGASELRACTQSGTYVIRPPEKWPAGLNSVEDFRDELRNISHVVDSRYADMAAQEGENILLYLDDMEKDALQMFGEKYGIYTSFEPVSDMDLTYHWIKED